MEIRVCEESSRALAGHHARGDRACSGTMCWPFSARSSRRRKPCRHAAAGVTRCCSEQRSYDSAMRERDSILGLQRAVGSAPSSGTSRRRK
jgi:hypothetical protein